MTDLTYQYRMNEDIMLLSNRLIYSDRLVCGSEEVASQALGIPDRKAIHGQFAEKPSCQEGNCLIDKLLDERLVIEHPLYWQFG